MAEGGDGEDTGGEDNDRKALWNATGLGKDFLAVTSWSSVFRMDITGHGEVKARSGLKKKKKGFPMDR